MYRKHSISIPKEKSADIVALLAALSPELAGVEPVPELKEDGSHDDVRIEGYFPAEVIDLLNNPKEATKRAKGRGNGKSEAQNRSLLNGVAKNRKYRTPKNAHNARRRPDHPLNQENT